MEQGVGQSWGECMAHHAEEVAAVLCQAPLCVGQAAPEPTPQHQEQGAPRRGGSKSCQCLWVWGCVRPLLSTA